METTDTLNQPVIDPNLLVPESAEVLAHAEQVDAGAAVELELPPLAAGAVDAPLKQSIKDCLPTQPPIGEMIPDALKPAVTWLGSKMLNGAKKVAEVTVNGAKKAGGKIADVYNGMSTEDKTAAVVIAAESGFVFKKELDEGATIPKAALEASKTALIHTVEYRAMKRAAEDEMPQPMAA